MPLTTLLPFVVGLVAAVVCNVAARLGMNRGRFIDRPGPGHIES